MPAPNNPLKAALAAGRLQKGIWLNLASPLIAEIAGHAGFDWCLIDGEHSPWDPAAIRAQLIGLAGTGAAPVVRVPVDTPWILKQVLDLGVQTVLVPMVNSADQARAIVRGLRYPPKGIRGLGASVARASGFGAQADYAANANDQICCLVQAESRAAIAAVTDIANVDGVDGVFIGPADLAADMGYRDNPAHPDVRAAIDGAISQILAAGKVAGILSFSRDDYRAYARAGVTFLGIGSDANLLATGLHDLAQAPLT